MQAAVREPFEAEPYDQAARDPEFIRSVAQPLFDRLRAYFRSEIEGGDRLPRNRPFIAVANHNGGPLLPDCWVLASHWWSVLGVDAPSYALVHDAALAIPGLRTFLGRIGGLRASRASAEYALARGGPLLIYPGGELDCLKSFWRRHRIDFRGRMGFIRLALEHRVPIVPVVNVGGHEVYVTLWSSERLARWTGLARLTRVKTLPLNLGLPWGVWLGGFVPYLPLPAKFVYRVGPPIELQGGPEAARDENRVRIAYARVTRVMQGMLDDLARRRRYPVFG
jgi:1-acyl-sn-glycerol-3-phosphate acyltransferase